MLVFTRKNNQKICIGDDIEITIFNIEGGKASVGVTAPKHVRVDRKEVRDVINRDSIVAQAKPISS